MSKLRRLSTLSGPDLLLLTEAVAFVLAVEIGLRLLRPKWCLAIAQRAAGGRNLPGPADRERLAWLVDAADRYAPGRSTCLRRALVLAWMLGRRGIRSRLAVGVARRGERLLAHAWLETEDGRAFGPADAHAYACLPLSGDSTRGTGTGFCG